MLNFEITTLLDNVVDVRVGYTLDTDRLVPLEVWTADQEEIERLKIFKIILWFPVKDFDCEYCGSRAEVGSSKLQYGFSYNPDDYDRIRILCEKCIED